MMTRRGLFFFRTVETKVWPNEPVPPVMSMLLFSYMFTAGSEDIFILAIPSERPVDMNDRMVEFAGPDNQICFRISKRGIELSGGSGLSQLARLGIQSRQKNPRAYCGESGKTTPES